MIPVNPPPLKLRLDQLGDPKWEAMFSSLGFLECPREIVRSGYKSDMTSRCNRKKDFRYSKFISIKDVTNQVEESKIKTYASPASDISSVQSPS